MTLVSENPPKRSKRRGIEPGTSGWTVDELDCHSKIYLGPRFEIVRGVLTLMAPARYYGNRSLSRLVRILQRSPQASVGDFVFEPDLLIADDNLYLPDAVWLSPEDDAKQVQAAKAAGNRDPGGRLLVPPTLIIESASIGHSGHDRETKFRDYAFFGVKNYWILDEPARTIDCFALLDKSYQPDCSGRANDILRPTLFKPIEVSMSSLW